MFHLVCRTSRTLQEDFIYDFIAKPELGEFSYYVASLIKRHLQKQADTSGSHFHSSVCLFTLCQSASAEHVSWNTVFSFFFKQ